MEEFLDAAKKVVERAGNETKVVLLSESDKEMKKGGDKVFLSAKDIEHKTYDLMSAFHFQYGFKPNSVYLGHREYFILTGSHLGIRSIDNGDVKLFDLDVVRVDRDEYLSVGFSISNDLFTEEDR